MPGGEFGRGYNSFSGVDIKAVFGSRVIAELQAISYSITREKAPLYTMGSADPRSFSRGKRGIAGTLIFLVFDRHALLGEFGLFQPDPSQRLTFLADKDDIRPSEDVANDSNSVGLANPEQAALTVAQSESQLVGTFTSDQQVSGAWYVDQLPPFDITLAAANEYNSAAVMRVFGVELLNEGYGVSIDDIVSEQQMTYVARTLVGWRKIETGQTLTGPISEGG